MICPRLHFVQKYDSTSLSHSDDTSWLPLPCVLQIGQVQGTVSAGVNKSIANLAQYFPILPNFANFVKYYQKIAK